MATLNPQQKLATARILAAKAAPFLQRALWGLIPIEDLTTKDSCGNPTFGVTPDWKLHWHPEALAEWTPELTAGVLLHEVSHLLRDHAGRFGGMVTRSAGAVSRDDSQLWNTAGDLEINDDLEAMRVALPEGGLYPKLFGFTYGQTAEQYFQLLKAKAPKVSGKCCGGSCGSGAGGPDALGTPSDVAGRSGPDMHRIKLQVAEAITQDSRQGRGSLPGGWIQWAADFVKPPKVRWQDHLSRVLKGIVNTQAGVSDYSYRRPSRRQSFFGWGPGAPIMPAMVGYTPRVAVGVDTSGSMGVTGISRAASELDSILRHVRADVDFVACDCQVHVQKKVRSSAEFAGLFTGGGGTSFIPAFEAVAKMKPAPSIFVFITDGFGDVPPEPPRGCKVVWVLCGDHKQDPGVSWGEKIFVDD